MTHPGPTSPLEALATLVARPSAADPSAAGRVLMATERASADEIFRHQLTRISRLVDHARRTVPFYSSLPSLGALDADGLRALPILRREDVLDRAADLSSREPPPGHTVLREANSSGSSGRHVTVKVDSVAAGIVDLLALRDHAWHRRDLSCKAAGIRAIPTGADAPAGRREPRWSRHPASGPLVLLDVHTPVKAQLEWLVREAPAYVATYASNAAALVAAAARGGVALPSLKELGTFGEVLPDGLRDACRRTWGVPVVDAYSSVELGHLALQCSDHERYHVQSESVLVEVLGDDGNPCQPGETGRVIVTALHAFVMPLIRYDIGDYATVGEPCPCGRGLPTLDRIVGRSRNMLRLPSGDCLWPRYGSNLLGAKFPLRQFRLVQKSLSKLVLELVVTRPMTADEERALSEEMLAIIRYPFELELRYLAMIPRSAGGKFEDFVCELDPRSGAEAERITSRSGG